MSLQAKIDKLERLAASTTFPGERANALAKAARLKEQLKDQRKTACKHESLDGLSGICLNCGANVWNVRVHERTAQQEQMSPSFGRFAHVKKARDADLVKSAQELKPWLAPNDARMADEFKSRLSRYGELTAKQFAWLFDIVERGRANFLARHRQG